MEVKKKYHLELDYPWIAHFGWGFFHLLVNIYLRGMLLFPATFCVARMWELAWKLLEPLGSAVQFPSFSAGQTNLN